MPRGKAQVQIIGASTFSLDENQAYEGLSFKLSKATEKDGVIAYQQSEQEVSIKAAKAVKFDTYFFDDSVKISVFQKNSYVKSN